MIDQEIKYKLCSTKRNKGHLEFDLVIGDVNNDTNPYGRGGGMANGNISLDKFSRYTLFDNLDSQSGIIEKTHNQINYFDCEGEYSRIIGISLYNEDYSQLESTLISIFKNRLSANEKEDYLMSKTLIIIISDGFEKLKDETKGC